MLNCAWRLTFYNKKFTNKVSGFRFSLTVPFSVIRLIVVCYLAFVLITQFTDTKCISIINHYTYILNGEVGVYQARVNKPRNIALPVV